jgi:hypothetical protein
MSDGKSPRKYHNVLGSKEKKKLTITALRDVNGQGVREKWFACRFTTTSKNSQFTKIKGG